MPFLAEAYYDALDRSAWGLVEVPGLQSYGGLIFGTWDPARWTLDDYLGDMRWYLDNMLVAEDMGGLVPYTTRQGYTVQATGRSSPRTTSVITTTRSTPMARLQAGLRDRKTGFEGGQSPFGPFEIAIAPGHGIGGVETGPAGYERELEQAEAHGPEARRLGPRALSRVLRRLKGVKQSPTPTATPTSSRTSRSSGGAAR